MKRTLSVKRREEIEIWVHVLGEAWDYLDHGYELDAVARLVGRDFKKAVQRGIKAWEARILLIERFADVDSSWTVNDLRLVKRAFKKHYKGELKFGL